MGLGEDAGKNAAVEVHHMVDDALPVVEKILLELLKGIHDGIENLRTVVVEGTGTIERSSGTVFATVSQLPGQIGDILDGMTIEYEGKFTIKRKQLQGVTGYTGEQG